MSFLPAETKSIWVGLWGCARSCKDEPKPCEIQLLPGAGSAPSGLPKGYLNLFVLDLEKNYLFFLKSSVWFWERDGLKCWYFHKSLNFYFSFYPTSRLLFFHLAWRRFIFLTEVLEVCICCFIFHCWRVWSIPCDGAVEMSELRVIRTWKTWNLWEIKSWSDVWIAF